MDKNQALNLIAKRLRIHSLKMTTEAGSGHPTTCLSMAEIASCLFFDEMRYNIQDPFDWNNDEFVLSKGHAAPLLWACYAEAGIVPFENLMNLRKISSPLEGHPTPRMEWVKSATGSLGQGLSIGVGIAAAIQMAAIDRRVYVVMGDGECAEGSTWEAANSAADLGLANLCTVVDINRLSQSGPTMHGHDIRAYSVKFRAFGWETIEIDGHDVSQILGAFKKAKSSEKPVAILARTLKGKGVSFLEDKNGWHGKPLKDDDLKKALEEIGPMPDIQSKQYVNKPDKVTAPEWRKEFDFEITEYQKNTASRRGYGNALKSLGKVNEAVVCIDGDVKNSTYAEDFFEAFPERSIQSYIAEQNMIGMGIGMAIKGYIPFMATFSAFLGRAHDQIRMAAYSMSNIKLAGSHAGISIGADGPSQMGLEDLAIFSPIPGCVVFYPCDAPSAEACVKTMAEHQGMVYIRTTRPATPVIYKEDDSFPVGGSKVIKQSSQDKALVVAAGITVFEALKAYQELKQNGIEIRIMDAYCVKPIDRVDLIKHAEQAGRKVVVVEDHYPSGGLGCAVIQALPVKTKIIHLAVKSLPRSGKPEELLDKYGISAQHIIKAVEQVQ
ncbi:MAG: transketolase [Candidatus Aminicenantes bacterium]|nr:transketolase [Candidatus Aminicenantes bacterium]